MNYDDRNYRGGPTNYSNNSGRDNYSNSSGRDNRDSYGGGRGGIIIFSLCLYSVVTVSQLINNYQYQEREEVISVLHFKKVSTNCSTRV